MRESLVDEVRICQAKKHHGYRLTRRYRGYWLCVVWCWCHRKRIYRDLKSLEKRGEEK